MRQIADLILYATEPELRQHSGEAMTIDQAAEIWGVPRRTARRWVMQYLIPAGLAWWVLVDDLVPHLEIMIQWGATKPAPRAGRRW